MARQSWPRAGARKIQQRIQQVIDEGFDGVRARFDAHCGFARNTSFQWFGTSPRVPDARTLARIAERCTVSLDWLLLGRGSMDGPLATERTAKGWLFDAVYKAGDKSLRRALDYGLGNAPEALWRIVVDQAAELPSLADVIEDAKGFGRDDD
jgi:hypothetical protein